MNEYYIDEVQNRQQALALGKISFRTCSETASLLELHTILWKKFHRPDWLLSHSNQVGVGHEGFNDEVSH